MFSISLLQLELTCNDDTGSQCIDFLDFDLFIDAPTGTRTFPDDADEDDVDLEFETPDADEFETPDEDNIDLEFDDFSAEDIEMEEPEDDEDFPSNDELPSLELDGSEDTVLEASSADYAEPDASEDESIARTMTEETGSSSSRKSVAVCLALASFLALI